MFVVSKVMEAPSWGIISYIGVKSFMEEFYGSSATDKQFQKRFEGVPSTVFMDNRYIFFGWGFNARFVDS